jgi:peptide-methionine (S)-S-oxide reductase
MTRTLLALALAAGLAALASQSGAAALPAPSLDEARATKPGERRLVLAGGCFWGIQAVFQHVRGVTTAVSGYSGGSSFTAHYSIVSLGISGHAESVQVTYDPSQVTLGQLLRVFFSVAHDPSQKNRQGPDSGTQYRSAIFYADEEQRRVAAAYVAELEAARVLERPIATEIAPLQAFYVAESYHQDYAVRHPDAVYIVVNDAPKVASLRTTFPELYVGK